MKTTPIIVYYKIIPQGICIIGTKGRASSIILPETIEELPLVALGDYAFAITQEPAVSLPEEETTGALTFQLWTGESLTAPLPQETETHALLRLALPDTISDIGAYAFMGCAAFKGLRLPEHLNSLSDHIFSGCTSVEKMSLPKNITTIGSYAFFDCRKLTALFLPENITTIGQYAFYNCRALEKINIPESAVRLGTGLFLNCDALYDISFGRCQHIADLISVLSHELLLTIDLPEGRAKLFLPDFQYEYIENTPARQLHQVNYGTGHLFRQCIGNSKIDFRRYDELFYLTKREDAAVFVLILAVNRLAYPYRLPEDRCEIYLAYIKEHLLWAVSHYLEQEDLPTIRLFASLGLFTKEIMPQVLTLAQEKKKTAILSFLMDYEHRTLGQQKKKTFDL